MPLDTPLRISTFKEYIWLSFFAHSFCARQCDDTCPQIHRKWHCSTRNLRVRISAPMTELCIIHAHCQNSWKRPVIPVISFLCTLMKKMTLTQHGRCISIHRSETIDLVYNVYNNKDPLSLWWQLCSCSVTIRFFPIRLGLFRFYPFIFCTIIDVKNCKFILFH